MNFGKEEIYENVAKNIPYFTDAGNIFQYHQEKANRASHIIGRLIHYTPLQPVSLKSTLILPYNLYLSLPTGFALLGCPYIRGNVQISYIPHKSYTPAPYPPWLALSLHIFCDTVFKFYY